MIDIKITNIEKSNKLSKGELKALILILISLEGNENYLSQIKKYLNDSLSPRRYFRFCKDIKDGLQGLVEKGILNQEQNYIIIKSSNISTDNKPSKETFWTLRIDEQLSKIYLKIILFGLSEVDFKILIKFISELKEFDYCENIVRLSKSKRNSLSKDLKVSVNTIKKSIMKLKQVGALSQVKYNKYKVASCIVYKDSNITISNSKLETKRIHIKEIPKIRSVGPMELEDDLE